MKYKPHCFYHIFNQGNNRQKIFFKEDNYYLFQRKMRRHLALYVDIISYCLMPNHFHWLIYTKPNACLPTKVQIPNVKPIPEVLAQPEYCQQKLSKAIGILLRSYTRAINKQENRTGSLFRRGTHSKNGTVKPLKKFEEKNFGPDDISSNNWVNHKYAQNCFRYIHNNPTKAGLVDNNEDWLFSSARDYVGLEEWSICNLRLVRRMGFVDDLDLGDFDANLNC